MDDTGSGEVHVAEAEVQAVAELVQPTAAPRPRTEDRVVDRADEEAPADERLPLPPLGHRPGGDGRGRVHERDHVEEEGSGGCTERGVLSDPAEVSESEAALPQEHPFTGSDERVTDRLVQPEVPRIAEPAEHERVAHEEEPDEPQAEDGEVRAEHVGCVLGPAEPSFDQREAGLHEYDEHGPDDHPEEVQTDADVGYGGNVRAVEDRLGILRSERDSCCHSDYEQGQGHDDRAPTQPLPFHIVLLLVVGPGVESTPRTVP
jgi:hypothetical protein